MSEGLNTAFCALLTVGAYCFSRRCAHIGSALTTPVFLSTALCVAVLWAAGLTAADYHTTKVAFTALLPAATVALAVPLYKNRHLLQGKVVATAVGILSGSAVTVLSAVGRMYAFAMPEEMAAAVLVKSVTAPIAVDLAATMGSDPALVAAFVIATGMLGAMFGPAVLNAMRVEDPVARAVSMGTVSHGQGAAQMAQEGEFQGAVAGVAMGVTAVISSVLLPLVH